MAPDHKQMGAYYTKADIAEYICKNTIIPCIFDIVQQAHPTAFTPAGPVWSHLIHAPDCYISPAIREQHRLPGESEREYQFRRSLYNDIHRRLAAGTITSLHDFLTYNLDSQRFAQDVLSRCTHSSLLRAFYQTISRLAILDPTCGPGAFLLAALSLLEPLYAACLTRMEQMLAFNACPVSTQTSIQSADLTFFKDVLNHAGKYTDRNYFIVKSIIANNLYGVDLMPEAVERCQQQLLRRLVAHQHNIAGIESLPAGEHNIRSGNALVGFTRAPVTAPAALYKQQTHFVAALNHVLAREYGIDRQYSDDEADYELAFQSWLADHKPFHWCSEFPRIMERGGFDVIIGNPPYIEYSKIRQKYRVHGNETEHCGNLYAAVVERSLALCQPEQGYLGLIVPLSFCGGARFKHLRQVIKEHTSHLWLANFDIFPSRLFKGAYQRLSILLARHRPAHQHQTGSPPAIHTTQARRWYTIERPHLLNLITYTPLHRTPTAEMFPKLASPLHEALLCKLIERTQGMCIASALSRSSTPHFVYYQEATNYWIKASCRVPYYKKNGVVLAPAHGRFLYTHSEQTARIIMALMNSSLFYVWFATYADGFHLSHALVKIFPASPTLYADPALLSLALALEEDIMQHATLSTRNTQPGNSSNTRRVIHHIELEEYHMHLSKSLLDEIDTILARHYGLNEAELDFIINYDIKYRMGKEHQESPPVLAE